VVFVPAVLARSALTLVWNSLRLRHFSSVLTSALPVAERGAWLASYGFVVHATRKQVSVV